MSSATLKWFALITMAFDHVGAVFFPDQAWIRIVGRVSFPIFAFLLVQGFIHTKSRTKYISRLIVFAIISEVPYDLCLYGQLLEFSSQNIMFELAAGFLVLICLEAMVKKKNPLYLLPALGLSAAALLLNLSYDVYGIALIVAFYLLRSFPGAAALASVAVTWLFFGVANVGFSLFGLDYMPLSLNSIQIFACASCVFLAFYNGKPGRRSSKYFFYLFYPAHLLLYWAISISAWKYLPFIN